MNEYNIYFDIASVLVMSVITGVYLSGRQPDTYQNKCFLAMLITNLLTSAFDFVNLFFPAGQFPFGQTVLEFSHMLYFAAHLGTAVAFYMYCNAASGNRRNQSRTKRVLFMVPAGAAALVLITNPFTHMLFELVRGDYTRRPLIFVFYFAAAFYALFAAIRVSSSGKYFSTARKISCYMYLLAAVLCVVIQYLYPYLLIEPFGMSLMLLLCYTAMEHPEEFVDSRLNVINEHGFEYITENFINSDTDFSAFCIRIHHMDKMTSTFGRNYIAETVKAISAFADREFPKCSFIRFSYGTFIIIIKHQDTEDFTAAAQKIENKFKYPWIIGGGSVMLRATVGGVRFPDDFQNYEQFGDIIDTIRNNHDSNTMLLLSDKIDTGIISRKRHIGEVVASAADSGGFEIYYQPIISSKDRRVVSAEALIRLKNTGSEFISPEEFIPIAESQGNIVRIGEFVFRSVCRFIREQSLYDKGIRHVEVNLSTIQCLQSNLSENFIKIMSSYDIRPEFINFEITETSEAVFNDVFRGNIVSLSDLGITFSIDDYGTGYSNTDYLFKMPFSIIKIDKKILWEAFASEKAMIVLENTINLAHSLGIEVVAEGVETQEHVDTLTRMGCEYFQGYYYSKPVPEKEFIKTVSLLNTVPTEQIS